MLSSIEVRARRIVPLIGLLAGACASAPVAPDPASESEARALAERAEAWCRSQGEPAGPPAHAFVTDQCTCWPDGRWGGCCVDHDIDYWCGGTSRQRLESDWRLRRCISKHSYLPGVVMFLGVRFGGLHWLPTPWRWGYGHEYPGGYVRAPLDPPEPESPTPEP